MSHLLPKISWNLLFNKRNILTELISRDFWRHSFLIFHIVRESTGSLISQNNRKQFLCEITTNVVKMIRYILVPFLIHNIALRNQLIWRRFFIKYKWRKNRVIFFSWNCLFPSIKYYNAICLKIPNIGTFDPTLYQIVQQFVYILMSKVHQSLTKF